MNNSVENPEREKFIRQLDAGQYIKHLRGDRSLASVCRLLNVTPAHLSEIERGRLHSDQFISALAKVYEVDEDILFRLWGKIPTLTRDELLNRKSLQRILSEMSHNSQLTEAEKDELYNSMYELYINFIENNEEYEEL